MYIEACAILRKFELTMRENFCCIKHQPVFQLSYLFASFFSPPTIPLIILKFLVLGRLISLPYSTPLTHSAAADRIYLQLRQPPDYQLPPV